MVKRIQKLWDRLDWFTQVAFEVHCFVALGIVIFVLGVFIGGCTGRTPPETSTAKAILADVQRYEVPIADTSTIPELLHLAPGQSAILLKDVIVVARIPYNGNELYVGEVRLVKGTMLVKPKSE